MLKVPFDTNQSGHTEEYIDQLKVQAKNNPHRTDVYVLLGTLLTEQGAFEEAADWLLKILEIRPHNESALFYIGNVRKAQGHLDEARTYYERAVRTRPDFPEAYNNLGIVLAELGHTQRALKAYTDAVAADPSFGQAYFNMGNLLLKSGKRHSAKSCYRKAIEINPDDHLSLNNLGNLYRNEWKLKKAEHVYKRALISFPDSYETLHNLGDVLRMQGHFNQAITLYERAIELNPDAYQVYVSLGNTYRSSYHFAKAISCYESALTINPQSIPALNGLGIAHADSGNAKEAKQCFARMRSSHDDLATRIKEAMIFPVIYSSTKEMVDARQRFMDNLTTLSRSGAIINDPYKEVGMSNFILALHGMKEKEIREKIANFYLNVCTDLHWRSPTLKTDLDGKIKIGFVSRYLHEHTIGRLFRGIIENLDQRKFEIIIFRFTPARDEIAKSIDCSAHDVIVLPNDLFLAREKIADQALDILFFPEIGMDALTYFIAFSRLAPIQCKKGFPVTTGIPTIDYFISSKLTEPPNADTNYSERLVRMNTLGYYLYKPRSTQEKMTLDTFGIPKGKKYYACLQSLFKLHPDFDRFLGKILRKDPDAVLLLLDGQHKAWNEMVVRRLVRRDSEARRKIHFLPRQSTEKFVALFSLADAVLDSIYFSGGQTSLECFALGIPVVTWPSQQMAGRLTYGYYQRMRVLDCIAQDADEYADIAFRLAHDNPWKEKISNAIRERSGVLFENADDVRELERFLENAAKTVYKGSEQ